MSAVLVQRPDPVRDFVDRQVAAGRVASEADVIIEAACRYAADLILGGPRAATPRSPTASPVAVLPPLAVLPSAFGADGTNCGDWRIAVDWASNAGGPRLAKAPAQWRAQDRGARQ